jgi:hypothetical protein
MDEMPKVILPPYSTWRKSLALTDRGLIGQFMSIWPSPKTIVFWIEKICKLLIKGSQSHLFCGRGFFAFLFEFKEDMDLIF